MSESQPAVPPAAGEIPVPRNVEEALSPEWLSAALGTRFPGIRVTRVLPGPVVSRLTTNVRFGIECAGGLPAGLPGHLCVKGYFTEKGWPSRFAGVPEAMFYRELADRAGIRTLRAVYADVDPASGANVVISEDVVAAGGTFLDGLGEYTPDQAAESLAQLARLHAALWGDQAAAKADWLQPRLSHTLQVRGIKEISGNFQSEIGAGVPEEVRDAQRLVDSYRQLAAVTENATPWTVIHGDPHLANVYLDGAGRPSFTDWQVAQRGPWYLDVGYHLATALTVADRRKNEDDLVRHYLDHLRAAGVDAPGWDEAWVGVRRGILHGFYMWAITLLVKPAITTTFLTRLGTAVADHDVYASVASVVE